VVNQMTGVNIVVPRAVLRELELLKSLERSECDRPAAKALQYLRSQILALGGHRCRSGGDRSSLLIQGDGEAFYEGIHRSFDSLPLSLEDDVLACVRYFAMNVAPNMTELLTADHRLGIKAAFHEVPSESVIMLMGRGVISSTGCQAGQVEPAPGLGALEGLPGLDVPTLLSTERVHTGEDYNCSASDSGREAQKLGGDDSLTPDYQDIPCIPEDESRSGVSFARTLKAIEAGRRCAASTRSPSSEDGSADPVEASPDVSVHGSPPRPPQATPPWHRVPDLGLEEECEEESMKPKDASGIWKSSAEENMPPTAEGCGERRAEMVVLRGLPFNVTQEDVRVFIRKAGVKCELLAPQGAVVLLANAQGRPSGFAEIRLAHGANVRDVRVQLHMQNLRGRYIEALPPRHTRKSATKRSAWHRQ